MAHLRCEFFSETLALSTSMTVLLPQPSSGQIGMVGATGDGPPPVLYLLHGLSDDDTIWLRRTSIERYAAPLGLAVVMPQVHRSFYTDEAYGGRFWTFLSEELPALVHRFFRVSERREDTYVAGLSMGGYGAFRWALSRPERFAAAASLSGALGFGSVGRDFTDANPADLHLMTRISGGTPLAGSTADLLKLVADADPATLPALQSWCGTEDFLFGHNRDFERACVDAGVRLEPHYVPGEHEWGFWDRHIQDVLAWMWGLRTAGSA
jgi:S-formylglutathione hydrolase FrmB